MLDIGLRVVTKPLFSSTRHCRESSVRSSLRFAVPIGNGRNRMMEKDMLGQWWSSANPVVTHPLIKQSSCNGTPALGPSRIALGQRRRQKYFALVTGWDINLRTICVFTTTPRSVFVTRMSFVMLVESTGSSACDGNALDASISIFVRIVTWPWTNMISLIRSFDSKQQRTLK